MFLSNNPGKHLVAERGSFKKRRLTLPGLLFRKCSVTAGHCNCKVVKVSWLLYPLFQFLGIGPSLKLPY